MDLDWSKGIARRMSCMSQAGRAFSGEAEWAVVIRTAMVRLLPIERRWEAAS